MVTFKDGFTTFQPYLHMIVHDNTVFIMYHVPSTNHFCHVTIRHITIHHVTTSPPPYWYPYLGTHQSFYWCPCVVMATCTVNKPPLPCHHLPRHHPPRHHPPRHHLTTIFRHIHIWALTQMISINGHFYYVNVLSWQHGHDWIITYVSIHRPDLYTNRIPATE